MSRTSVLAGLLTLAIAGSAAGRPLLPEAADRAEIFGKGHVLARAHVPARGVSPDRGYDVDQYDLAIEVLDGSIAGTVTVDARSVGGALVEVVLDLHDDLSVGTIMSSHGVASTSRADDFLTVTLGAPVPDGETFSLTVPYDGVPPSVGGPVPTDPFNFDTHGEAGSEAPAIFTLSVPWRSGAWWPCKEELSDRATIDIHVTVADTLVAVSNGVLTTVDDLGDGRLTFNWSHGHPISPYLVMLGISDYELIEDSANVTLPGRGAVTIPLDYYVFPEKVDDALVDFERMPQAMQFLSDAFGIYPFADEKYGMALVPWSGGMEHQTCVSLGNQFVRGDKFYEWVFVHELSHHWWGDHITLADWRHVWLNEGFATYTEALWTEHIVGEEEGEGAARDAYVAYMDILDAFPPPSGSSLAGRIYDPSPLYGEAPYNKGAWVLHMLRGVVGDDLFLGTDATSGDPSARGILREYVSRFGGEPASGETRAPVTTDAFAQVVKEVVAPMGSVDVGDVTISLEFIDTFFDQWIQYPQRPAYRVRWNYGAAGNGYDVVVDISQTQTHLERYEMPIPMEIALEGGGSERRTLMNDARTQSFTIHVDAKPTGVTLDPERWLLRNVPVESTITPVAVPVVVVNPARRAARITYLLTRETDVSLRLFDGSGRRVRTLASGVSPASRYTLEWDGTDDSGKPLASGVYFVELTTPSERRTTRLVFLR